MLKSIKIANFAVIQNLKIDFGVGLNVLTGETGSGKSIIVDALAVLLGARSSSDQIRTGERLAVIEGLFGLRPERDASVRQVLAEIGVEKDADEDLLIRRELYHSGKSRNFISDQNVTAGTLRLLQPHLVEIHGQGEQRALLSPQSHMEILDSFGGCVSLRDEVKEAYARWRAAAKALSQLERELSERERATDLLEYERKDIEAVAPRPGEDEELAAEKKLLAHAGKIMRLSGEAYAELYESDESILSRLSGVRRKLEELNEIDVRVRSTLEEVESGVIALTDAADALRAYSGAIEFSPARLSQIEDRLAELERLKRKYNTDLQGVVEHLDEIIGRLGRWNDLSARESSVREELAQTLLRYVSKAERLTACRRKAGPVLTLRVEDDLRDVAMERARFVVSMTANDQRGGPRVDADREEGTDWSPERRADKSSFGPHGADRVEFLLSANVGEEPKPLARVASGGELSRLMLTLRTVSLGGALATRLCGTMVFDEVDVGISGRVAEAVGRRLASLSAARQVLCVTHQPQIARFADRHYVVSKTVEEGRTNTAVSLLNEEERISELARMIGGAEQTQTTRQAARWLLNSARAKKKRTPPAKKKLRKA